MKNLTDRILYVALFTRTLLRQQTEGKPGAPPRDNRKEIGEKPKDEIKATPKAEGPKSAAEEKSVPEAGKKAEVKPAPTVYPRARAISPSRPAMNFDHFFELVEAEADLIPQAFFDELNLGIIAEDREKRNPAGDDLFIMGEYRQSQIGNQICLFYGSFVRLLGLYASEERYRTRIREVLRHEFRHHMEGRAGIRDLEIEDQRFLNEYMRKKKTRPEDE